MNNTMKLKKMEPRNYWMQDVFPSNFNQLVNSFFNENVSEVHAGNAFFRPSTDIKETDTSFEVEIALAGIKKDDIKIELNNGVLMVSGERSSKKEENTGKYHLNEIQYGKFSRRFTLPENTNADKIEAKVEDGVLFLSIPKSEEVKPKLISVK